MKPTLRSLAVAAALLLLPACATTTPVANDSIRAQPDNTEKEKMLVFLAEKIHEMRALLATIETRCVTAEKSGVQCAEVRAKCERLLQLMEFEQTALRFDLDDDGHADRERQERINACLTAMEEFMN